MNSLSYPIEKEIIALRSKPEIDLLFNELTEHGEAIIFGGACRDWIFKNRPKDIDIVTDCSTDNFKILSKYHGIKNSFGGYKITIAEIDFDIWNLESTWAFNHEPSLEKLLNNICSTAFFNLDAIIFNIVSNEVFEKGFVQGYSNNVLDIVFEPNKYPFNIVSKAMAMLAKYKVSISDRLRDYINIQIDLGYNEKTFKMYQIRNYKKEIYDYETCMRLVNV